MSHHQGLMKSPNPMTSHMVKVIALKFYLVHNKHHLDQQQVGLSLQEVFLSLSRQMKITQDQVNMKLNFIMPLVLIQKVAS
jgi:hypothetical protein